MERVVVLLEFFGVEPFKFGSDSGATRELVSEEREYGDESEEEEERFPVDGYRESSTPVDRGAQIRHGEDSEARARV